MAKPDKSAAAVDYELNTDSASVGKGHATPTRKEREAANLRPLVNSDRKAASKASRAKMAEARDRARIGMANGEEKYLVARDRGPQRKYIRDFIDARFSVGEIMIPIMFVVIILTFVQDDVFQVLAILGLWLFFILAVIDCLIVGFRINRKLSAKFGADQLQRGNRWYAAMRALQLRMMRLPKPQVKRGQYPN
ncbi:DUF3043 domain-containing protein [Parafrigoribacterium mesophilum]|uniref:DUF3043 domain-containing protein n=1 Tax=Parafrigoribacterium mesophilum TaxID=433646 RepID=UPI0031FD07C1